MRLKTILLDLTIGLIAICTLPQSVANHTPEQVGYSIDCNLDADVHYTMDAVMVPEVEFTIYEYNVTPVASTFTFHICSPSCKNTGDIGIYKHRCSDQDVFTNLNIRHMEREQLKLIADACFTDPAMPDVLYFTSDGQAWLPQYKTVAESYIRKNGLQPPKLFRFKKAKA